MNTDGDITKIELVPFATPDDLARVWHKLSVEEIARAEALLEQASNYLRQIVINNQGNLDQRIADDTTGVLAKTVEMVILSAVQRIMSAPEGLPADATQWTQSATPYSESMGFSGGVSGNLFFKARELELLGINSVSGKSQISLLRGVR